MIKSDSHVHTSFSSDSSESMEEQVKQGIKEGLSNICFTDHMDFNYPDNPDGFDFLFDPENYFVEIERLEKKYAGQIEIRRGIELGVKPGIEEKCRNLFSEFKFDFVINSTHLVNNMDPYYPEFWDDKTVRQGLDLYYAAEKESIDIWPDFDVLGHVDYMTRYTPEIKEAVSKNDADKISLICKKYADDYFSIIEDILKTLIERGRGIEINTSGIHYGLGHTHPQEKIVKLYHDLGGEIITVGSDAHEKGRIAADLKKAEEILKEAGFKYYTEFRNRKPEFILL